jgi:hypothetical protein
MARRPLPILADVIAKALVKPIGEWSKRAQRDLAVFSRAIGITPEQFTAYAPSTRKKYISAARAGRTAAEERARVREQRKERENRKRRSTAPTPGTGIRNDPRFAELQRIRDELYEEGYNDEAGDLTQTDSIAALKLYSDDSLEEHVKVYGFDYVLDHARGQLAAVQAYNRNDRSVGQARIMERFHALDLEAFAASAAVEGEDERWYWYHTSTLHY